MRCFIDISDWHKTEVRLSPAETHHLVRVMRARIGLQGHEARTLEDIGAELGITREYVRQIQNHALSKMRRKISALGVASV